MIQFLLGFLFSWALVPVPTLVSPVMDQSAVFSPEQKRMLESELQAFQKSGKAQIQILTIPTLDGEAIEDFSIRVAEAWKTGDAKTDNGVLILLVTEERKARIEVGQGLEGELTDAYTKRILAETARPFFKNGDYPTGLRAAALAVMVRLNGDLEGYAEPVGSAEKLFGNKLEFFLFILFFGFFILSRILGFHRPRGFNRGLGGFGGGMPGGWSGGGGGWGSGGGGWSGGGGGFSGGGSSDSW